MFFSQAIRKTAKKRENFISYTILWPSVAAIAMKSQKIINVMLLFNF
jgi:hypothetical protein